MRRRDDDGRMATHYIDHEGRSRRICWDGDVEAAEEYIRENLASDDPADHVRASEAMRELDAYARWQHR